ncbi:general transcription factor iih polypeptide 2 [Cyclospora cayetanensis]|uniref:General transcription factor iih polypeptide 2 n=1 Tax=Cyclospora cayetanensis TaxID=88456 RepID=A0A1D3CRU8_9EIME|nr:general transcription factor iih polypeptide 2 [Cyclospora cayetanensis]
MPNPASLGLEARGGSGLKGYRQRPPTSSRVDALGRFGTPLTALLWHKDHEAEESGTASSGLPAATPFLEKGEGGGKGTEGVKGLGSASAPLVLIRRSQSDHLVLLAVSVALEQPVFRSLSKLLMADYPSVDEVLQGLEGNATASATALEQDIYGQYAWEREVERSWECVVEAEGQLRLVGGEESGVEDRQGPPRDSHIKRALLRQVQSLVILIDATDAMRETDFKPDRLTCATQLLEDFLESFLLQNPLAQIALVFMADAAAEVLCPAAAAVAAEASPAALGAPSSTPGASSLTIGTSSYFSSNVEELVTALVARRRRRNFPTAHAPSLKNGLDRARALLGAVPPYCTREVLVLYGSIRTCDVGSIEESIEELKKMRARCSIVSLSPEVHIVKTDAALRERSVLDKACSVGCPPCVAERRDFALPQPASLSDIHVPPLQRQALRCALQLFAAVLRLLLCGAFGIGNVKAVLCTFCGSFCVSQCCSLHLLSPADVSRSFHSLCLPEAFEPVKAIAEGAKCCCCHQLLERASRCPDCRNVFCRECDIFSHEQLRHCPFCVMDDIANIGDAPDSSMPTKGGPSNTRA